jgi:hypothetical protein
MHVRIMYACVCVCVCVCVFYIWIDLFIYLFSSIWLHSNMGFVNEIRQCTKVEEGLRF